MKTIFLNIGKKKSSTSKSKSKSKHKHEYIEALFIDKNSKPHVGTYCVICGKVQNILWWETEPIENGQYGAAIECQCRKKCLKNARIWRRYM